ncbi:Trm112 family protein [Desulfocurvibacter africanus]|uniref:Trm112 family protein n=1 Tax=Desulfocurvibacter africanus TaxID=873 RepID=UPI00042A1234|nr:Trm112 family protein [Desulfocurvibacter africanus]
MTLNKDLLDILACPKCKGDLRLTPEEDGLICEKCGVAYPIRDEIPIMLVEEAIPLTTWEERRPAREPRES